MTQQPNELTQLVMDCLEVLGYVWQPYKYKGHVMLPPEKWEPLKTFFVEKQKVLGEKTQKVIAEKNKMLERWHAMSKNQEREDYYTKSVFPMSIELNVLVRAEHLRALGLQVLVARNFGDGMRYLTTAMRTQRREEHEAIEKFVDQLETFYQNCLRNDENSRDHIRPDHAR